MSEYIDKEEVLKLIMNVGIDMKYWSKNKDGWLVLKSNALDMLAKEIERLPSTTFVVISDLGNKQED